MKGYRRGRKEGEIKRVFFLLLLFDFVWFGLFLVLFGFDILKFSLVVGDAAGMRGGNGGGETGR